MQLIIIIISYSFWIFVAKQIYEIDIGNIKLTINKIQIYRKIIEFKFN